MTISMAINRNFFFSAALAFAFLPADAQRTITQYLSGTDKDHTVAWDFYCTTGRRSGKWDKIAVPSNWELQGFGTYNYFTDTENPEEQGWYRHVFPIAKARQKSRVFIVFEGSMTDTEVKINGQEAGPVHRGGYYRFKYDITELVKNGDNLLEVKVSKRSANASVNVAFRHIHRSIRRSFADLHFQQVIAVLYQFRDIVFETIITAPVYRPRLLPIDLHLRIRHRSFEHDEHPAFLTGFGDRKNMPVPALLFRVFRIRKIIVGAETLQFPIGGNGYLIPLAAPAAGGAVKVPGDRMILIGT